MTPSNNPFYQALILATRLPDAAAAAATLRPGPDRAYIMSEAAWRGGRLAAAAAVLEGWPELAREAAAVARLRDAEAGLASKDRMTVTASAAVLLAAAPEGSGLAAHALAARGRAALAARDSTAATADAAAALDAVGDDVDALRLAADAARAAGDGMGWFLALRALAARAPTDAALLADLARAAAAASAGENVDHPAAASCGPAWAFAELGVARGAARAAVRAAWRAAAAARHPDRGGSEADFVLAKAAYDAIVG